MEELRGCRNCCIHQKCEARMAEQGRHEAGMPNVDRFRSVFKALGSSVEPLSDGIERVRDHACCSTIPQTNKTTRDNPVPVGHKRRKQLPAEERTTGPVPVVFCGVGYIIRYSQMMDYVLQYIVMKLCLGEKICVA